MKKFFTLSIIIFFIGCAAMTKVDVSEEDLRVQRVLEVELNKGEIYSSSLQWMAKKFVDSKEVIEVKDAENGRIIGKGITHFTNIIVKIPCRYTITIEAKDGKARVTMENFTGLWGEYHNQPRALGVHMGESKMLEEVKINLNALADDLYNHLTKSKSDDDW